MRSTTYYLTLVRTLYFNKLLELRPDVRLCVDVGFACVSPTVTYQRRLYLRGYSISGGCSMVLKKLKVKQQPANDGIY